MYLVKFWFSIPHEKKLVHHKSSLNKWEINVFYKVFQNNRFLIYYELVSNNNGINIGKHTFALFRVQCSLFFNCA